MQGVVWAIPKEMFELLGGGLTGSLALSFIPAVTSAQSPWEPLPLPLLAHAVVYAKGGDRWLPAQNRLVELTLSPKIAAAASALPRPGGSNV